MTAQESQPHQSILMNGCELGWFEKSFAVDGAGYFFSQASLLKLGLLRVEFATDHGDVKIPLHFIKPAR